MSNSSSSAPPRTISTPIVFSKSVQKARNRSTQKKITQKNNSCETFIQKFIEQYATKENIQVKASQIIAKFKIHKRKVYQFLQILQGCGCLIKPKYGLYKWIGIARYNPKQSQITEKVKAIAYYVKQIIDDAQQSWYFKNDQMFRKLFLICAARKIQISEQQLKRKVQICLKVLVQLKLLFKIDDIYHITFTKQVDQLKEQTKSLKFVNLSKEQNIDVDDSDPEWSTKSINEGAKKKKFHKKNSIFSKLSMKKQKQQIKKEIKEQYLKNMEEKCKQRQQRMVQKQKLEQIANKLIKVFWEQSQKFQNDLKQWLVQENIKGKILKTKAQQQFLKPKQGFKKFSDFQCI